MIFSTFGDYLAFYLKQKGLTRRNFSELMGMKSKTGIDRLIANKSSGDTVMRFSEEMVKRLELSSEEYCELKSAVINHFLSDEERESSSLLKKLFVSEKTENTSYCKILNGEPVGDSLSINEVVSGIDDNTLIILEGSVPVETIYAINELTHSKDAGSIKILHFFNSEETVVNLSLQLLALLKLLTHLDYNPYSTLPEYSFNSTFVALSENNGEHKLIKINYMPDGNFHMLRSSVTPEMYNYFSYEYQTLAEISKPLRMAFEPDLTNLLTRLEWLLNHDDKNSVSVENGICFMMIPIDIQKKLFKDCGYLGMSEDSDCVSKLISVQEKRATLWNSTSKDKRFIITRSGIKSFIKTGMTGDHFPMFRPLDEEEIKKTVENALNSAIKIRILKDSCTVSDANFSVYDGNLLFAFDPIWGWWENSRPISVNDSEFVGIIDKFLKNDLWELCCFNDDESEKIIKDMINS